MVGGGRWAYVERLCFIVACEGGRAGVELLRDYCGTATGGGVRMEGAWRGYTYDGSYIHTIRNNERTSFLYNTVSV